MVTYTRRDSAPVGKRDKAAVAEASADVTIRVHVPRVVVVVRVRRSLSPIGIGDIVSAVVDVATRADTTRTVGIINARRS